MTEDAFHRSERWRAFYEEEGGLREMITGLRKVYFQRASELSHRDTMGLQKLSYADKIAEELDRQVQAVIAAGDVAVAQNEHVKRIEKVGRFY